MRFFSAILGTTALMGTQTLSAGPDMWEHDEMDIKLRGKFEAEAKVDLDGFMHKLREKHGHYFDETCAEACFRTPGCRFDPHEHWSYCKYDHHPPTCFGLYHVPKHHHHHRRHMMDGEEMSEWGWGKGHRWGRLCYEPTQRNCPEEIPVLCKSHRPMPRKMEHEMMMEDEFPRM